MNSAWTRSCSKEILRDAHTSKQIPKTFALPHRFSNLLRSFMSAVSAWRDGKGRQSRVKTAAMSKIKKYYWLLQTRFPPMWVTSKYLKYDLIYQGLHGSRVSLELIIDDTESTVHQKCEGWNLLPNWTIWFSPCYLVSTNILTVNTLRSAVSNVSSRHWTDSEGIFLTIQFKIILLKWL